MRTKEAVWRREKEEEMSKELFSWTQNGRRQLAVYQRQSNSHIMTCLGMKFPNEVLDLHRGVM